MTEIYCKDCEHFDKCVRGYMPDCPVYYPKKGIMTNEEWFCLLSVEDKAMALEEAIRNKMLEPKPFCHEVANNEYWLKWLKEKHE